MLLRLVKKSHTTGYFLFFLIVAGAWVHCLLNPFVFHIQESEVNFGLFGLLNRPFSANQELQVSLAFVFLTVNSLLLFRIYREYLFFNTWSLLPAVLFVLLTSGIPGLQSLYPVLIAILFLSLAMDRMFAAFYLRKPYRNMFEAGFLLSLGSLFYFHLLVLLPLFLAGGRVFARDARWREVVLVFTGGVVPWIFLVAVYFLFDKTEELFSMVSLLVTGRGEGFRGSMPVLLLASYLGLLILAGSFKILGQIDEKKASFRKFYAFFFFLFVSAVLAFVFIPAVTIAMYIVAAVPVTFLLSNYFESVKEGYFGEILFLVIIILVVLVRLS